MRIGDIYRVNLDPTVGDEIRKRRPVVILNPGHARHLRLAIVVPVTQWRPEWDDNPFFVTLEPGPANGLDKKSAVDCFQVRAISHDRLLGKLGIISEAETDEIKRALALIMDIDQDHCR